MSEGRQQVTVTVLCLVPGSCVHSSRPGPPRPPRPPGCGGPPCGCRCCRSRWSGLCRPSSAQRGPSSSALGSSGDADVCTGSELLLGPTTHLATPIRTRAPVIPRHVSPLKHTRVTRDQGRKSESDTVSSGYMSDKELLTSILEPERVPQEAGLRVPVLRTQRELEVSPVVGRHVDPDL